jgi:hypothetical protein
MRKTSLAGLAAMVAAGFAAGIGGASVSAADGPGLSAQSQRQMSQGAVKPTKGDKRSDARSIFGSGLGSWGGKQRRAGYGWTNMHARRVATKKRNVARHRKACRG